MYIIPAILTEDSDDALRELSALKGVAQWVQIDVMDHTITPDETFDLFELCGEIDDFDVEVHLMVSHPEKYFAACAAIDARRVYFHPEPVESVYDVFAAMSEYDFERGLSISPETDIEQIRPYIDEIDAVQVMTVDIGEQGQKFMLEMLEKVRDLKEGYPSLWVGVDGGVNKDTLVAVCDAGADAAGVGSAISSAQNSRDAYFSLQSLSAEKC